MKNFEAKALKLVYRDDDRQNSKQGMSLSKILLPL